MEQDHGRCDHGHDHAHGAAEVVGRVRRPEAVHGWLMVVVAAAAVGVNVVIGTWLHHGTKHDINIRSADLHMIGDAVSALGVVVAGVGGVRGVHDLHVWTVGAVACSCHIIVGEQSVREGQQILKAVAEMLGRDFGVGHTTVQVEVEGHESDDMYCMMRTLGGGHVGHRH